MPVSTGPVVIGVDGSTRDESALRAGVAEARRLGVGVRLVHVVPDYVALSPMLPLTPADFEGLGSEIVGGAAKLLRTVDSGIELDAVLLHGARPKQLVEAAKAAPVLVVGRDDRSLLARMLRGNTATGVAAVATCPVLSVPAEWQPAPTHGTVLVGVRSPAHAAELLGDAFAAAAARGDRLLVLHAWKLPSGYDDIIESRAAVEEWTQRSTIELDTLLAQWRAAYPDVDVETRVVHAHPVTALVEASEEADVLIVVRRAHGVPAAVHLGSTARAVLRLAHCPVRVIPPKIVTDAAPELVLEQAGTLQK